MTRTDRPARVTRTNATASALFAANPLPMWLIDERATRVLDANEAALQRYGLARDDAIGLNPTELVRPEIAARFRSWVISAEGKATEGFEQRTPDGGQFPAELRVNRIPWGGREARLVVVRDIGARRRVEERLRQSQKMEAVGRLSGSIAHDFNNLLTAIGGYADLLLASLDSEDDRREDLMEVRRAVDRGAALTRQLLAFSRRQIVQPHVVNLNDVVEGMRPLLERLLGERVRLVLGLGPRAGSVSIDRGQLEQVILNLALNGRDAMPHGGQLLIETAQVELDEPYAAARGDVRPGRYGMLAVSDEGVGLSEEARDHLFEPFFTTKPRGQGTGLGLATVYGILRQASGHIDVYSQPEFGTTFRIYLPAVDAPAEPQKEPETPEPLPRELAGRVVVAEDDPVVRRVITETLVRAGLDVRAAGDGAAALELIEAGPPPDVLVTDVRMPRLSGPELARAALVRWPLLAVVFVSGHTGPDTPDELTSGGHRFLGKPFSTEGLLREVASALGSGSSGTDQGSIDSSPSSAPAPEATPGDGRGPGTGSQEEAG
jgi:two-component system, cell cycle sensor histidine kinase and response regulator CckA